MSMGAPCAAQENVYLPTVPVAPDVGDGRGSLFAPSGWLVLSTPVQQQIDLKLYGFYIGRLDTPVAQVDVPIRTTKFLTVTPSYMYYSVPESGLNKLPPQPGEFTDSYDEHQFRIDGTVAFAVRKFEISGRNMYVIGSVQRQRTIRTVTAEKLRSRIPSPSKAASGSLSPHTKPITSRLVDGTESAFGLGSRCHSARACSFSRPTCGRPVTAVEPSTTCCSD